jgi:hypothetical protein
LEQYAKGAVIAGVGAATGAIISKKKVQGAIMVVAEPELSWWCHY